MYTSRLEKMGTLNWMQQISFQKSWDLHIFINSPGDEMWMSYIAYPLGLTYLRLDVNNTDGMTSSDLTIGENNVFLLDSSSVPCKSYVDEVKAFNKMIQI
jgi:hypothetical protein